MAGILSATVIVGLVACWVCYRVGYNHGIDRLLEILEQG